MNVGMIGLGRMGANLVRRLMNGGHSCYVYDKNHASAAALVEEGAIACASLAELAGVLPRPGVFWVMLPSGEATETTVLQLKILLGPGDVVVDGGNTYFKNSVRHADLLAENGIELLDVGTSGGVWGLERGYCLMVGGRRETFDALEAIFMSLAPGPRTVAETAVRLNEKKQTTASDGYLYCGPSGSGHFVKMIHNGIEYGLMQAFAEGFDILEGAASNKVREDFRYKLDLAEIAEVWRRGSVVSSWLLDLLAEALDLDSSLSQYRGEVDDSGEGRWTIQAAMEEAIPAGVISAALFARFRSRQEHTFADKALSAMRHEFGGHVEPQTREQKNVG